MTDLPADPVATTGADDRPLHRRRERRRRERRRRRLRLLVPVVLGGALVASGVVMLQDEPTRQAVGRRTPLTFASSTSSSTTTTTTTSMPLVEAEAGSSGVASPAIATSDALLANVTPVAVVAPVSLSIERLGALAPIDAVGIDALGDVAVPADSSRLGWYRHGAAPGADGSAVIVGHVDFDGRAGPFFRLGEATPGDVITVGFSDGTSRSFAVSQRGQYPKDQLPTAELFRTDGPPRLVLITCGGQFRSSERSYADNVVVLADPLA